MFPYSGKIQEGPARLGPLERANLNHWTGTDLVSETMCFLEHQKMDEAERPSRP
jgi:hypothetical protein